MRDRLQDAIRELHEGGYSLVLYSEADAFYSKENGIKSLLSLTGSKKWQGAVAADKIVGKAAAMLYVLLGVKSLYADVLSTSASTMLDEYGIQYEYGVMTDRIINRRGDGDCPMEEAVREILDPADAPSAIREKLLRMKKGV